MNTKIENLQGAILEKLQAANVAAMTAVNPKALAQAILNAFCPLDFYSFLSMDVRHISEMQKLAQFFYQRRQEIVKLAAEFVATVHFESPIIALLPPMRIKTLADGKVQLRLPLEKMALARVPKKSVIYYPGAGITSAGDFAQLLQFSQKNRMILDDINPFVVGVLRFLVEWHGAHDRIQVVEGDLAACDSPDNVGLALCSLLHKVGKPALEKLAASLFEKLHEKGDVVLFFPEEVYFVDDIPAQAAKKIFLAAGFVLKQEIKISYKKPGLVIDETYINKTGQEIFQILRSQPGMREGAGIFCRFSKT